ncbi:MAG: sulfatase [Halobacteriaceae archaeon]
MGTDADSGGPAPDRPNVVQILTDQQHAWALGAADPSFDTPHLDALAARGTRFTGAHCTHPQCSPSRSSLVTGRFPHQTGVETIPNWGPFDLDADAPSVGRAFRDAGYRTAWFGKWHLGMDNLEPLGWETVDRIEHNRAEPPDHDGTYGDLDDRATDAAVEFVRDGPEPFFATLSLNLPHPPFYEDPATASRSSPAEMPLPVTFDDDLDDKPAFHAERQADCDLDPEATRTVAHQYRTMVSKVDDCVGRLLAALRAAGIREETAVVFTSDHGDMQGAHGLDLKGVLAYDELLRVPLLVDVPWLDPPRDEITDLVSLAGVPGTLCDAAGLDHDVAGGSLLDALARSSPPADDRVFFEHRYAYWGEHPYRGVRTRDWKYVDYLADDAAELYDVSADPLERQNRADDPAHADVRASLSETVRDWWQRTGGDDVDWAAPLFE